MKNTHIDIRLEGSEFSPKKLMKLTNLPLEVLAEKGEIAHIGRYKGKPFPYGMALLEVKEKSGENFNAALGRYMQILLKDGKKALMESGVNEVVVDIETSPSTASGFSFEESLIHAFSQLNARIVFQTIENKKAPANRAIARTPQTGMVAEPTPVYKKKSRIKS
jgi:hypothetical protein